MSADAHSTPTLAQARELPTLRLHLRRLRRQIRTRLLVAGLAGVLVLLISGLCLSFGLDYLLDLDRPGRMLLDGLLLLGLLVVAWRRLLRPLSRPVREVALACLVESRGLVPPGSLLSSALSLASTLERGPRALEEMGASEPQVLHLLREAEVQARDLGRPGGGLLRRGYLRGHLLLLCLTLLAGGLLPTLSPRLTTIWAQRHLLLRETPWPRPTTLRLAGAPGGLLQVPHGDPLRVRVQALGLRPGQVWLEARFDDGSRRRLTLTETDEGLFRGDLESVVESGFLVVQARRAHPARGRIQVIPRPVVEQVGALLDHPPYMALPARRVEEPTLLEIPAGTRVTLGARATKPLLQAWLTMAGEVIPLECAGGRDLAGAWTPSGSGTVELHVEDRDGLDQRPARSLDLQVLPDTPPEVALTPLGVGPAITPVARIRYQVHAEDDHGLAAARLELTRVRGQDEERRGEETLPDPILQGQPSLEQRGLLEVEPWEVQPGDLLRVRALAEDLNDLTGPGQGASETYTFKVVTAEQLMLELFRQQLELRREFQRALQDQGEIVQALEAERLPANQAEELERLERSVARRVRGHGERFGAILEELDTNQLSRPEDQVRIRQGIIDPLEEVVAGPLRLAAETLGRLQRSPGLPLEPARTQALAARELMAQVLENMVKQETYGQVLALLREIIRLHDEAGAAAREERRRQIMEIFEEH